MNARPPASQAFAEACAKAGLDADGAHVIGELANSVYRLADPPIVVRLRYAPDSPDRLARLTASVQVTAWLKTVDFPTVTPFDVEQPVTAHGYIATFWRYVPPAAEPFDDIAVLADLLRQLHGLPAPPVQLPDINPLGSLRDDVSRCAWLTDIQRSWLLARCDTLERQYAETSWTLGRGLVHGDAYTGNLIHTGDGAVLADWDSVGYGPREQDIVPTWMRLRFGEPKSRWERFCDGYGANPDQLDGLPVLLQMRELRALAAYIRTQSPAAQAEVGRRIADLMSGKQHHRWTSVKLSS
jgi:aminoglycoside phosphotransferase (APT) family kinase protein